MILIKKRLVPIIVLAVVSLARPPSAAATSGDLDPGFGAGGKTVTDFPGWEEAWFSDIAIQGNGKIITAGTLERCANAKCTDKESRVAVARYLEDGSLDPSFGGDGRVNTAFHGTGVDAEGAAVAIQANGKIVVGGSRSIRLSRSKFVQDFALVRYLPDGSLDPTFGAGGRVVTALKGNYAWINELAILSSGKILASGNRDFTVALARYRPDGSLDLAFGGGDGRVVTAHQTGYGYGMAGQDDGSVVAVAGFGDGCDNHLRFSLTRFHPNGSVDESFGNDGTVHTKFRQNDAVPWAVAVQPDGRIVAAGRALWQGCGGEASGPTGPAALVRYRRDGSLDPTFGGDGRVFTSFYRGHEISSRYSDVAILPGGKILAAGSADDKQQRPLWVLARYRPDGTLDPNFGNGGKVVTKFTEGPAVYPSLAVDQQERAVLAGLIYTSDYQSSRCGLARYVLR